MKTLYLIDGYAQFFRAYHAIRTPMTSPVTKEPTNLTFGFIGMLLKLLRGEGKIGGRPDYIAVTIDVSGDRETFRSTIFPDYKAHRPPPPDDLFPQVERCLSTLRDLGVPVLGAPGVEADDVIATLVTRLRASDPNLRIRIVSKDKDLKQLLAAGENPVEMYDIHTDQVITAESLHAECGLTPAQVIDMLALMGDTVDNIPGVTGVGEKTAAQLICQYGSLENLLAHADEIKGKRGENIRAAANLLPLSRRLVALVHDVPIEFDLADAHAASVKVDRLLPVLRELGFNRYQEEVKALLSPAAPAPAPALQGATPQRIAGGLFDHLPVADTSVRSAGGEYKCITTREELAALTAQMKTAPIAAVDTETTGLSPLEARLCGISISLTPGTGFYIPVRSPAPGRHLDEKTVLDTLRPILEDPDRPKCGHNLKYDLLIFRRHGVELRGLSLADIQPPAPATDANTPEAAAAAPAGDGDERISGCDSMVASFLIDASRSSHSLDALALALLGRTNIPISDLIGSGRDQRTFDTVPIDLATCYAAEDADVALQLREKMLPQLRAMGLMDLWERVEMPLVEVLAELEWNGILVDPAELDRQRDRLALRIEELATQINTAAKAALNRTFNPDSPRQLAEALFNKPSAEPPGLGLKSLKKTKTGHSTDIEVLEKLAADPEITTPIPALIVEYRQLTKLVGTYLVALKDAINPETRRIHASFNQTVAVTGRLSSSDPNLQNIPIRTDIGREIRRAFIAPPGSVLISADYSQIELRLLAHLSQDPNLCDAIRAGQDIHTAVAAQVYNVPLDQVSRAQRAAAKMVNFGIVYGVTAWGLARRLKVGEREAAVIISDYKKRFAGIATYLEECIAFARRFGYVETMLKRRRPITEIDSNNPSRRALAERLAINSVVQGSAADMIKIAMIDLHRRLRPPHGDGALPGVRMLLQIHDELVFEAPAELAEPARALVVERMTHALPLSVPIEVDSHISTNWFDGK